MIYFNDLVKILLKYEVKISPPFIYDLSKDHFELAYIIEGLNYQNHILIYESRKSIVALCGCAKPSWFRDVVYYEKYFIDSIEDLIKLYFGINREELINNLPDTAFANLGIDYKVVYEIMEIKNGVAKRNYKLR